VGEGVEMEGGFGVPGRVCCFSFFSCFGQGLVHDQVLREGEGGGEKEVEGKEFLATFVRFQQSDKVTDLR
jgi:hypothetical protein